MYTKEIQNYLNKCGFEALCPKAVLFDMDGVLYNSMPNHAYSWHNSMKRFGLQMSEADAYKYEGMRGVETIKLICREQWGREISDEESQKMYDVKSQLFATCPEAKVMDGVQDLMRMIKECGMQIVVVTGSGQRSLLDKLVEEFHGLVMPELIVSSFDVTHGKPNPEPYLKGLLKVNAQPWEAIVVENAPLGVRAGVAANIFTVAVNSGPLPNEMLAAEGASIVFDNMPAFRDEWQALVGALGK
ncbi:MAG: HAD-IA family hydrolase [Prevotella sp.]|nr:HAD-IA family hydrolase [Prevotella sp.]